jgi:hypothetical protein
LVTPPYELNEAAFGLNIKYENATLVTVVKEPVVTAKVT